MLRTLTRVAFAILLCATTVPAASALPRPPRIVLDAGHGGADPGAVNCDYSYAGESCLHEADVNLRIVRRTNRVLAGTGLEIDLTRTRDVRVNNPFESIKTWNLTSDGSYRFFNDDVLDSKDDLQARVNIANCAREKRSCRRGNPREADAFVSIHSNSCGGCGAKGATTYYYGGGSRRLARLIKREVTERTDQSDRGAVQAAFYVVRWTRMPAALLESGFVDHKREARRLMRRSFQMKIARGVRAALLRFVCTEVGSPGRDVLAGTAGRDVLCGLEGNDQLRGFGRGDVVLGGRGGDVLRGGAADDYLVGGPGLDACFQGSGEGVARSCEAP